LAGCTLLPGWSRNHNLSHFLENVPQGPDARGIDSVIIGQ